MLLWIQNNSKRCCSFELWKQSASSESYGLKKLKMMKSVFDVYPVVNGLGAVTFAWQKSVGNYLAISGLNKIVNIYDRHGEHRSDVLMVLPGVCTSMDWDKDGDILAVTQDKTGVLFMWNVHNFEVSKLDTGLKEPLSLCIWAKHTHILAVGTNKGNVLLYNHRSRRKVPILGKHTKRIICGAWSSQNLLALGAEDKSLTISNADGDTIRSTVLRAEPYDIHFSMTNGDTSEETTVSVIVGHKTLFLYDMDNSDNPIELAFQPRYGDIITYKWYGEGFIMIGFSNGFFVLISTDRNEIGQELFQSRNHKNFLSDVAISDALNQVATCGDNSIKVHDMKDLKEVYNIVNVEEEKGTLHKLQWTDDGQLLTVSTLNGGVFTYLAKLPMLGDSSGTRLAYLTSLLEVTIVNNVEEEPPLKLSVTVEPSFVALGPFHIAVGMNDRVWIHEIGEQGELFERSYLGTISSMQLNGYYAAALFEGKIELHQIDSSINLTRDTNSESSDQASREGRMFPNEGRDEVISCMGITQDFLIYGTESGNLMYFFIEDWQFVNEFKHVVGISKVFPDPSGTRLVLIDDKSDAFVYNPVNDALVELPDFPPSAKGVLWENWPLDKHVMVVYDEESVCTYVYHKDTLNGSTCHMVGVTKLPFGHKPLMLYNGEVSCQTLTGKISIIRLNTHNFSDVQEITEEELRSSMRKYIVLKRFKDAWSFASALNAADSWSELAEASLHHIDIDMAIRCYQQVKNVAMVYSLQQIQHIEDHNLLVGHVAVFMESYNHAQELFLSSTNPVAALEMRRDLLHWDQALNLAKTLAPDQIPFISKEYAQQLEFTGDYGNALLHYESGVTKSTESAEHDEVCNEGIARMTIRTGDIRRGVGIAQTSSSKQLKKDCATILESLKLYAESGVLYEDSQCWDKAATVYIKTKNWNKVGEILKHSTSPKLHAQYAKAREADRHYKEAAKAYEIARDYDNATRIYLDHLQSPDDAVRIVKESRSTEGAKMVAKFFQKLGDAASALQFLVLSHCQEEAFNMAEAFNHMDLYADAIGDDATVEDYLRIATHFQRSGDHFRAGQFYLKAKDYSKALQHFMHCSPSLYPDGENIDLAIQTVGEAKNESLTQHLSDYLMGEVDETPKDAKYLFRLYLALEQYREAARTAILIAREDQAAGNYRNAHDVLFYMYSELQKHEIKIPSEMVQNLMVLHSYILVKLHVKKGDHMKGARMLIRVANNISKFPSHIVPILTSTVIECHRSGLKNSAFSYAAMLMRPEYRQQIDTKWKKKIEQIVRKPDKSEIEEPLELCPFCENSLPQSTLDCPQCKNNIPYCIVTGRHMVKDDWTHCTVCKFPALYTEFKSLLENAEDGVCPMCSNSVKLGELTKLSQEEVSSLLRTQYTE